MDGKDPKLIHFFINSCIFRCNGNRGWFPSNFVKVIEEYNSNTGTAVRKMHNFLESRSDIIIFSLLPLKSIPRE